MTQPGKKYKTKSYALKDQAKLKVEKPDARWMLQTAVIEGTVHHLVVEESNDMLFDVPPYPTDKSLVILRAYVISDAPKSLCVRFDGHATNHYFDKKHYGYRHVEGGYVLLMAPYQKFASRLAFPKDLLPKIYGKLK